MKKTIFLAYFSAIALIGSMGLTACSEDLTDPDPNIEAPVGEVPVQFVFNISTSTGNNQTRLSDATVQTDGYFRGIDNAHILAYQVTDNNQTVTNGKHVSARSNAKRHYDLSTIIGKNDISESNSTRVIEISLPNATNALMFYGKAPKDEGEGTQVALQAAHASQGYTRSFIFEDNTNGKTKFMMMPRVTQYELDNEGNFITTEETEKYQAWTQTRLLLTTILNRITENGLHIEQASGNNGARDLRARIWWPRNDINTYSMDGPLVDLTTLDVPGEGTVSVTTANSDISKVYDAPSTNATVTLRYKPVTGDSVTTALTYIGVSKQLITNVETYTYHIGEINWKDYGQYLNEGKTLTPLEEILGNAYNAFTNMKTDNEGNITELRAGSAMAIIRMIEDLWTVTNQVLYATPTSLNEAQAQLMAKRIHTRFFTYFTADEDLKTGIVTNCKLKATKDLVEQVRLYTDTEAYTTYSAIKDYTDDEEINSFPTGPNLKMPAGSTQLLCRNGVFSYNDDLPAYGMGMDTTTPLKYTWPSELIYFGNSPIRTSNKTLDPISFPQTVGDWTNSNKWTEADGWNDEIVTAQTRSVAMRYPITYANAMLGTEVYYANGTLEDNNSYLHKGESNNVINVTTSQGEYTLGDESRSGGQKFELTGIVIGGQPMIVGWDFLQKQPEIDDDGNTVSADNSFTYMVYDNEIPKGGGTWGGKIPDYNTDHRASLPNYTLLWDNWDNTLKGQSQSKVYVALEFRNCSGKDFWGKDNLVRDGGIFYLIGMLDPNKSLVNNVMTDLSTDDLSEGIVWPEGKQALPPYDGNGNTIKERRVFIQSYKTMARFGIGQFSLQNAYITVPDLRSANISLGLSVDLVWKNGLSYDIVIGEN